MSAKKRVMMSWALTVSLFPQKTALIHWVLPLHQGLLTLSQGMLHPLCQGLVLLSTQFPEQTALQPHLLSAASVSTTSTSLTSGSRISASTTNASTTTASSTTASASSSNNGGPWRHSNLGGFVWDTTNRTGICDSAHATALVGILQLAKAPPQGFVGSIAHSVHGACLLLTLISFSRMMAPLEQSIQFDCRCWCDTSV